MNFVITDSGRSMASGAYLVLTLEMMARQPTFPYHITRNKASRKRMLAAGGDKPMDDETPLALKQAASEQISDRVRADADKFVSARASRITPTPRYTYPGMRRR